MDMRQEWNEMSKMSASELLAYLEEKHGDMEVAKIYFDAHWAEMNSDWEISQEASANRD